MMECDSARSIYLIQYLDVMGGVLRLEKQACYYKVLDLFLDMFGIGLFTIAQTNNMYSSISF